MSHLSRRRFLQTSALGSAWAASHLQGQPGPGSAPTGLRIAPFRFDVTPPLGHPLCGGWISPALAIADPLEAIGFVLLGAGDPIVVCAVDWTGLLNGAHLAWREAMARAAGTVPERVAVQCVHQHDAPFVCLRAEEIVAPLKSDLHVVDPVFFQACVQRAGEAIRSALPRARPLTHLAQGEATVTKVASNRRMYRGPTGLVDKMRASSCRDPELIALPEGLIDPQLKTVAFYSGAEKVVACHYYATHPMSSYGKGQVGSDFAGLARKRRQAEDPGCTHLYFTGAAGNISAGKYNDGSPEAKVALIERIYRGIADSEKSLRPAPIGRVTWSTTTLHPPADPAQTPEKLRAALANTQLTKALRTIASMRLSLRERCDARVPIVVSALHVDHVSLLHLPAESFIEYQLRAQALQPGRFIATAAYGDGGPWYVPTRDAYPLGGYEVSVAFCTPEIEDRLTQAIRQVLTA